jgi:hypothetical protein
MLYIAADPPKLRSRAQLEQWMWRFHNAVNRRLGKPCPPFAICRRYCVGGAGAGAGARGRAAEPRGRKKIALI